MSKIIEKRKVFLGHEQYEYQKHDNGDEILVKTERIKDKNIDIILKSNNKDKNNSKDIESFIVNVLSEFYIKRNMEKYK